MRNTLIAAVIATTAICGASAEAGKVSPVQSSARPLGLKTVAPVMMGATDGRSKAFMEKFMPAMNKAVEQLLPEGKDNRGTAFGNKFGKSDDGKSDEGKSDDEKKKSEDGKSGNNGGKGESEDSKSGSSNAKYESDDGKSGSSGKESSGKESGE
ncbi:MAG: hypothetical protein NT069_13445, partial [Planctomycetota bacterium]|nr:hypothetical protein [Planctomycetota bacterium]